MPHPYRLLALTAAIFACFLPAPASAVTDEQVDAAVKRMQAWLFSQQKPSGEWISGADFHGKASHSIHGEHVMVTYALLASGVSAQDPRMEKALRHLRQIELMGTYSRGVSAHIWAALPDQYLPNLASDAEWLLRAQRDSIWDYGPVRKERVDHSTTQYGILGLWEFAKRGGRTPETIWEDAVVHFLRVQTKDGAWTYNLAKDAKPRGSMTAAGLTVLYVAQQQLFRDADKPPAEITASIQKGLAWLDRHFSGTENPGGGGSLGYYLYGVERVGLAGGIKTFKGQDWFEAGAKALLAKEAGKGHLTSGYGQLNETSFALMFLARGRVPVWITKLQFDGDWNNRPNDIYFLTRYLSDFGEQELNWQTVSLDLPADQFTNAPVAYLSSDEAVTLTEKQVDNLRDYLDRGGLLLANTENNATAFQTSIESLAKQLYPDHQLASLGPDHPLTGALYGLDPRAAQSIRSLSNGARDLIFLTSRDWGKSFQSDLNPGDGEAWDAITNLYALVTDRGTLENRLAQKQPERKGRESKGEVRVVRARYDGPWDIERRSWDPLKVRLFNQTGLELNLADAPLEDLGSADAALVHLAGTEPVELTPAQIQAIRDYVAKGGTVLVETVGGRGDFSVQVEQQLQQALGTPASPLGSFESIITGDGLAGGGDARRVIYRPYSVIHLSARTAPRLAAFNVDGRPAILVSHEDLSLGAMGLRRWAINGYQPDSARQLLTNILLAAKK